MSPGKHGYPTIAHQDAQPLVLMRVVRTACSCSWRIALLIDIVWGSPPSKRSMACGEPIFTHFGIVYGSVMLVLVITALKIFGLRKCAT